MGEIIDLHPRSIPFVEDDELVAVFCRGGNCGDCADWRLAPAGVCSMANGAAALALLPPASASAVATAKPSEPIETAIGIAVASAVFVLYRAILDQQENDALAPATKDAGASRIARIAMLQLDHELGDADFTRKAHEQGKGELRRFFNNTDLFRQHDPVEIDKVFDTSISDVLGVVSGVVRDERVFRAAWAN